MTRNDPEDDGVLLSDRRELAIPQALLKQCGLSLIRSAKRAPLSATER